MPERMFQYAGRITEKYPRRPIYAAVIYLNEADRHKNFPNVYEMLIRGKRKTYYEFDVIKVWEIDAETILNQKIKGLLPLVPLMRYEGTQAEQIVSRCIEEIQEIEDRNLQADTFAGLYVLSGLKKLKHIIRRLIMDERIEQWLEQSETYQEILSRGLKKGEEIGRQEGVTEGLVRSILAVLHARFGEFTEEELAKKLRTLEESRLSELVTLAVTAESLAEFEELVKDQSETE
jgi:predicted transposase YdaD